MRLDAIKICLCGHSFLHLDKDETCTFKTVSSTPLINGLCAGKIAVIGGCREYTGAPYFAAISALKIVGTSMNSFLDIF